MFTTYQNQHTVIVNNDKFTAENSQDNPYGMLRVSSSRRASRELSGTAYKMFVELALNKDGYAFALSPEALHNDLGISKGSYKSAKKELIERGYLYPEPSGEHKNCFVFTPSPPRGDEPPKKKTKSNGSKNDIGQKMTHENEECPVDEQCPTMGQNMPCDGSENIPMVGQNMSYDGTENVPETIQDSIYNTDNNIDSDNINESIDDDWALDEYAIERNRNMFYTAYREKIASKNRNIIEQAIINTYLRRYEDEESSTQRRQRSEHGIWINGWDSVRREPVMRYSNAIMSDCEMKHNIEGIPTYYYRDEWHRLRNEYNELRKQGRSIQEAMIEKSYRVFDVPEPIMCVDEDVEYDYEDLEYNLNQYQSENSSVSRYGDANAPYVNKCFFNGFSALEDDDDDLPF